MQRALPEALEHKDVPSSVIAHAQEHALEVQLPFLQSVLDDFELVPICVGMIEPQPVAEVMAPFLNAEDTLVVVSSDLSHFHDYQSAKMIDAATIDMISVHKALINHEQACGATAINALLLLAEEYRLQPTLLDYRNSGAGVGDKSRVVGYASMAWL